MRVGFRLVCDNCSVQEYCIVGMALVPSLKLMRLGTEQIMPPLADLLRPKVDQAFADLGTAGEAQLADRAGPEHRGHRLARLVRRHHVDRPRRRARTLEDVRSRYPKSPLQGEVTAKLAVAYSEKGSWAQAAAAPMAPRMPVGCQPLL